MNLGFNLLSLCAFFGLALMTSPTLAASSCQGKTIRTCASSLQDLEKFQVKNREDLDMQNIVLKDELLKFVKSFNGRPLVYNSLVGDYTLLVKISDQQVRVDFNGKSIEDAKLCVQVCRDERALIWYHPQFGSFTKIQGGLRVGEYEFILRN